ncbi:predicted protein [Nematostella vectensis]|uniref:Uncharacterized protein n=1 Tax=Nematostella vectensis TaxID=45351 RepID=A7RLF3_NEMVE|nr:predicted protein [Nematostella vectensis]|eukprot:XP_001639743.1 predicted protein [Nematostella vectensis]
MGTGRGDMAITSLLLGVLVSFLTEHKVSSTAAMRCCFGDCMRRNGSLCGLGRCQTDSECVARYRCIHRDNLCLRCSPSEPCPSGYVCKLKECELDVYSRSGLGQSATIGVIFGVFAIVLAILLSCLVAWRRSLRRQQASFAHSNRGMAHGRRRGRGFGFGNASRHERSSALPGYSTHDPRHSNDRPPRGDSIVTQLEGPNEPPPPYSTLERSPVTIADTIDITPPSYEEAVQSSSEEPHGPERTTETI